MIQYAGSSRTPQSKDGVQQAKVIVDVWTGFSKDFTAQMALGQLI